MSDMNRTPHTLRRPRGSRLPSLVIFLDAKTVVRDKGELTADRERVLEHATVTATRWRGTQRTRQSRIECWQPEAVWSALRLHVGRGSRAVVICRDAYSTLTTLGVWRMLGDGRLVLRRKRGRTAGMVCIEHAPFILDVQFSDNGGSLQFLDSANFGLPANTDLPSWYGRYVCLLSRCKLGPLQPTIAGQAWYGYRARYMPCEIQVHDSPLSCWLERLAYYGGRCEPYKVGSIEGPVYHLDVRSMYSAMAATRLLPVALDSCVPSRYVPTVSPNLTSDCGIFAAKVRITEPVLPWSPGREHVLDHWIHTGEQTTLTPRLTESVIYPVGTIRGVWTAAELDLAGQHGEVIEVHGSVQYRSAVIGREWGKVMHEARQTAREEHATDIEGQLKLMTLLVWGKFAQRGKRWVNRHDLTSEYTYDHWYQWDDEIETIRRYRCIGGVVQEQTDSGETRDSCPSIAAHVTAYARVYLWALMEAAGHEHVYYCDTDSLWVGRGGLENLSARGLLGRSDLGSLELRSTHAAYWIGGPKHYRADGRTVCAGVRGVVDWSDDQKYSYTETEHWISAASRQRAPEPNEVQRYGTVPRAGTVREVLEGGFTRPWEVR